MTESTIEPPGPYGGTGDLTENERYCLLAEERRRMALDVLTDRATPVDLEDLAAAVVARVTSVEGVDEETVERMAIRLHHGDLPKMADLGVIDYDPGSNCVTSCPRRPDPRSK